MKSPVKYLGDPMKTIAFFCLLFHGIVSEAQPRYTKKDKKFEAQVWKATQQLAGAMTDADSILLDKLTSPKLSYGHSGGTVESKMEFIRKIMSGKSDFVKITMEDPQVTVSGKMAMVRFVLHAETLDNNVPGKVHLRVLLIWQRSKKHWLLIARQSVKNPV